MVFVVMQFFLWLDDYIDTLQHLIVNQVVLAPLLLLFVEEMGIPIIVPGDAILAYTGYILSTTDQSSIGIAFFVALAAVVGGSSILFFVSKRWGQMLILKIGKFVFLKEEHIQKAERLFARFGPLAIIFGRHIPGLRIPITLFAATSGVRYRTFIISTIISTAAWILFYLSIGKRLGANFHDIFQRYLGFTFAVVAGITVGIVVLHLVGMYRRKEL